MESKVKMTGDKILAIKMRPNDAEADTVREYLCRLAEGVALFEEGFSGKRPFGNSGWQKSELHAALVYGGAIDGAVYDDRPLKYRQADADAAIRLAIKALVVK